MAPFGYIPPPSTGGGGGGGAGEVEIAVTVAASKFVLDGVSQQDFTVLPGMIYKFDVSHTSNTGHVFSLSLTDDNAGSSEYTTGRTRDGTPGGGGSENVQWDVPLDVADTVYYYCSNHSAMGGELTKTGTGASGDISAAEVAVSTAGLEKDIAALAFKMASTNSLEKFSLDNQIIDDFKTQANSAIDESASTNITTDSYGASQAGLLDTGSRWSGFVQGSEADSLWGDVGFMWNGNETVSGGTFTAESGIASSGHTVTVTGATQTNASGGKFSGVNAFEFAGSSTGHKLEIPIAALDSIGTDHFTLEFWIYHPDPLPTDSPNPNHWLIDAGVGGSSGEWDIRLRGDGSVGGKTGHRLQSIYHGDDNEMPTLGQWSHYVWLVENDTGPQNRMETNSYLNGEWCNGYAFARSGWALNLGTTLTIGRDLREGYKIGGVRFTKGMRYKGTNSTTPWSNYLADGTTPWTEITSVFPNSLIAGNAQYNNIELVSDAQTASVAPATADIVMMYDDTVGTATLNTDIKAWASRDNGTTWTEGVLVAGDDVGGEKTASANDINIAGQPSGTSIRYKITTHNQSATKLTSIGGVSLGWDDPTSATVTSGATLASIAAMEFTTSGLEDSIATLGFKVASQNSLAKFDLPNQIIDDFKTQADSAVDESASTNITTDSYGAHSSAAGRWNGYVPYDPGGDPHWANVTLLVTGNETVSGGTFTTSDSTGHTATIGGSASQDSTLAPFSGGKSFKFRRANGNDSNPDKVSIPAHADWALSMPCTLEWWFYKVSSGVAMTHWSNRSFSSGVGGGLIFEDGAGVDYTEYWIANTGGAPTLVNGYPSPALSPSVANGEWVHVAVILTTSYCRVYFNGQYTGTTNIGSSGDYTGSGNSSAPINFGHSNSSNETYRMDGNIAGLRVTSGIERYTDTTGNSAAWTAFDEPTAMWLTGSGTPTTEAWNDIALVSDAQTATTAPTTGDVVVLYDDTIGAATLNTDIKAWVSRDNGTTYTEGILVASDASIGGEKIASAHDIAIAAQPSGTQVRYKITTHNQSATKLTSIGGVSLGWKDPASATVTAGSLSDASGSYVTYTVAVAASKFVIDGVSLQELSLLPGMKYRFDVSDSTNTGHLFQFSTTENGTNGGGTQYTSGFTVSGTAGTTNAFIDFVVPSSVPDELYYFCATSGHTGYGAAATPLGGSGGGVTAVANFNALPDASTVAGQLHYVTATGLVYFSNGVQHSLMGSEDPDIGAITADLGTLDHANPAGGDSNWANVSAMVTGDETPTQTVAGDQYYKNVSFHFNFDQNPPVDQSYYGVGGGGTRTVTMGNSATTNTSVKKWGTSSLAITGGTSSNHYMHVSNGGSLGTGNFTLEGWVYPTSLSADKDLFFSHSGGDNNGGKIYYKQSTNALECEFWHGMNHSGSGTQGSIDYCKVIGALTVNKWSYFVFERYGKNIGLTVYNDGDLVGQAKSGSSRFSNGTVTTPGNHPLRTGITGQNTPADQFVLGQSSFTGGSSTPLEGYLDDWRLTTGVSRYRLALAPLPTAAFPVTTAQRVETIPERKASKVVTNTGSVVRPLGSADPYWDAVSLYMDFNTTPFVDSSPMGWEFEEETSGDLSSQGTGSTEKYLGTGSFKFGDGNVGTWPYLSAGHGLYINDAGPGYFQGSEDWTIELIHRQLTTPSGGVTQNTEDYNGGSGGEGQVIMACGSGDAGGATGWSVGCQHGRLDFFFTCIGAGGSGRGSYIWNTSFDPSNIGGWWQYLVVERKGSMIYQHTWLLGTPTGGVASWAGMPWVQSLGADPNNNFGSGGSSFPFTTSHQGMFSNNSNTPDSTSKFSIGRRWNSTTSAWNYGPNGYLDSLRITAGVARYNGSPPPKPVDEGSTTGSLMRWPNGNKNFSAAWGGGVEHVGKGNSAITATVAGSDYTFGTGALTIEGWIYMSSANLESIFWDFRDPAGADTQDQLHFRTYWNGTDYNIKVYIGNTAIITSSSGIDLEQWYHVALTRNGSSPYQFELFIDAASKGTANNSTSLAAGALSLGSYYKGTDSQGFIPNSTTPLDFGGVLDDFKVTKGAVRTIPAGHANATGYPSPIDAGGITHTYGATGISGSGTPMNTTTLAGTTANPTSDETGAVLTYGIKDDQVTVTAGPGNHSPSHAGTKTATEAGLVVHPTTGSISITSPSAWEGDTISFQGKISDGVNAVYKTISYIVKSNFGIIASSGDPLIFYVDGKTIMRFMNSGSFTCNEGSGPMEWYCIGGGGAGGRNGGGGGGGGAVRSGTETVSTTGGNGSGVYTVVVGAIRSGGGTPSAPYEGNSSSIAFGGSTGTITSNGGGFGGERSGGYQSVPNPAYSGNGSGGGTAMDNPTLTYGSGTYGNDGGVRSATNSPYAGGGGGGFMGAGSQGGTGNVHDIWGEPSSAGFQGGKGGAPIYIDWDGTNRPFAGGGGGGSYADSSIRNWCGEGVGTPYITPNLWDGYVSGTGGGYYGGTVLSSATLKDNGHAAEFNSGSGGGGGFGQANLSAAHYGGGHGASGTVWIRF